VILYEVGIIISSIFAKTGIRNASEGDEDTPVVEQAADV
jgi:hypothetical protein